MSHRFEISLHLKLNRASLSLVVGAAAVLCVALTSSTAHAAAPPTLWQKCTPGDAAGQCDGPSGLAVDPASGHIFIAESGNDRITELDAWGVFVRAFGWGVVASGSGNEPQNETQELTIDATAGDFRLRYDGTFGGEDTVPIAFDAAPSAVQLALEGLPGIDPGDVAVSSAAGGAYSIDFIGGLADADVPTLLVVNSTLSGGDASVSTPQPGANFEICVPDDGDVCRAGQSGIGGAGHSPLTGAPGQTGAPTGLALDSAGDLYVVERNNRRVEKFDLSAADVQFEWMAGGGVNQGPNNPGNVCSAADLAAGDSCGIGSFGSGPAHFGGLGPGNGWPAGAFITIDSGGTATAADDQLWVGDVGRIQRFDTSGAFQGEIALPGETVKALATNPAGELYVSFDDGFNAKDNVHKLTPTGAETCTLDVEHPDAIAADAHGGVHVVSRRHEINARQIVRFDAATCAETDRYDAEAEGFAGSTGIAASSACGIPGIDLYVAYGFPGVVRASGPPPDPSLCPAPAAAPGISESFALAVGTDSATVRADINPNFWNDATYKVQYGTADCSLGGCATTPAVALTDEIIDAEFPVEVELAGLEPNTTYHYRFVTQSSGGGPAFDPDATFTTFPAPITDPSCANQAYRTGASAKLPDCRAYELVSPLDKAGGDIWQGSSSDTAVPDKLDQATPDGAQLTYSTYRAFGDVESADYAPQYIASRDPATGWGSHGINPPRSGVSFYNNSSQVIHLQAVSEDLCQAFFISDTDNSIAPGDQTGFPDLYRRNNCAEPEGFDALTVKAPENLNPGLPPGGDGTNYVPRVQGFSSDGSLAIFRANAKLTPNATAKDVFQLYAHSGGALRLVSVLPSSGGEAPGGAATTNSSVGILNGGDRYHFRDTLANAVSADGSRVFWTTTNAIPPAVSPGGGRGAGRIYLRLNPDRNQSPIKDGKCTDSARACTIAVSESVTPAFARFWGATPSGSRALFSIEPGISLSPGPDPGALRGNLYTFDVETKTPTLIGSGVEGVMGASQDLSRIYFASDEVLAPGGGADQHNLYLYDGGTTRFIASLSADDVNQPDGGAPFPDAVYQEPVFRSARVSPDGAVAAFNSFAALTGAENTDAVSGLPDAQVFRYDSEANGGAGELRCVSCNRSGARPHGRVLYTASGLERWVAATLPGWEHPLHASRLLSGDGDRLFFNSFDALDPRDTNGAQDVYQWQAPGKGDCDASDAAFDSAAGGCVNLISSGQSPTDSEFVDASEDGSDVFLRTAESLIGLDPGSIDIYDARIGGGLASQHPSPPAPPCEADACRGAGSSTPATPGAGSAAFAGPPDPRASFAKGKRCPKGKRKVLRRGRERCAPKQRKHNQRAAKQTGRAGR